MGHGPAVGHCAVFNGPRSLVRKLHQYTPLMLQRSLCALSIKVNGSPPYFIISLGHGQKQDEKAWPRIRFLNA